MKRRINKLYLMVLYYVIFGFKIIAKANGETINCNEWGEVLDDFQNIFDFCKIIIPLLIIGLSVMDFIKAVAGKDDKDLKKAGTRLMKRLALAIAFFFLPLLLNYFLELMGAGVDVCVELEVQP